MTTADTAVMNTYARFPVSFDRGEGMYLIDTDGNRYLDFCGGIAVCSLGHAHPHLVAALTEQAGKLWHTSNLFRIPNQEKLAKRLADSSFADRVFFTNSGVEAIEGSIKAARRYHAKHGHPEKWRTITIAGAFHGRSLATIAAAGNSKYLDGFGKPADGFDNVPFDNMNVLRETITAETAAILVEPIQGEGGINPASIEYMRALREAADEFGLLLILDEIQCGMGRTGKLWAHEWAGIEPDIMAAAKGIGGGFPLGAILAKEDACVGLEPGTHGTTYGGNPLATAVGNAVLDVLLDDNFLGHVEQMGKVLRSSLEALVSRHPNTFEEVRGTGLMLGLKCTSGVTNIDVIKALLADGMLAVGAANNVIRLLPPLILEKTHIDEAIEKLDRAAAKLETADA